ncbi:MAG: hypothetical protein M1840_008708 [Geoglossum simile]|nr:MAG: hypothetical protein M1840_008708 [Geoglossum simile]
MSDRWIVEEKIGKAAAVAFTDCIILSQDNKDLLAYNKEKEAKTARKRRGVKGIVQGEVATVEEVQKLLEAAPARFESDKEEEGGEEEDTTDEEDEEIFDCIAVKPL